MGVRTGAVTRYPDRLGTALKGPSLHPWDAWRQVSVRHVQHQLVAAPYLFSPEIFAETDPGPNSAGEPRNGAGGQTQCHPRIDQVLEPASHTFEGVMPFPNVLEQLERRVVDGRIACRRVLELEQHQAAISVHGELIDLAAPGRRR